MLLVGCMHAISVVTEMYINAYQARSRIHDHAISLRFLGIILKVLRLEVSVCNVYMTNKFQNTFAWEGGGGGVSNPLIEVTVNSKEENS